MAFCGSDASTNPQLLVENTQLAVYICFAYKIPSGRGATMYLRVETDGDPFSAADAPIPISVRGDARWHYKCFHLRDSLVTYSQDYLEIDTFIVKSVRVEAPPLSRFDTVTLRSNLPFGYESESFVDASDQSASNLCTFPFRYKGVSYNKCTLDERQSPICVSATNQTFVCQSSSLEGLRRLFPKYQLLPNSLNVTHLRANRTIDLSFR